MLLKISNLGAVNISKDQILDTESGSNGSSSNKNKGAAEEDDDEEGV